MRILITLYLTFTLAGCAVVSVSQHQTAETLGEGSVRVTGGIGFGRDIASGTIYAPEDDEESDLQYSFPLFEVGMGIGITERTDIGGMLWTSIGGAGVRTYGKFALSTVGAKTQYAIAPGIVYNNTEGERTIFNQTDEYKYTLLGLELPLMMSYRASSVFSFYGSGRVHLYSVWIDDPRLTEGREFFFLAMPGITGGIQLRAGPIELTPEVSTFFIYDRVKGSGSVAFFPNIGLSFRI